MPHLHSFDRLRLLSMGAIVTVHASASAVTGLMDVRNLDWWIANLTDAMSRWGLNVFLMISGALLLSKNPHLAPGEFYSRRLARILPPLVFWSLFYLGWAALQAGELDLPAAARAVVVGRPYFHLWFLYAVLGLYAVAPLLSQFLDHSPPRLVLLAILIGWSLAAVNDFFMQWGAARPKSFLGLWPPSVGSYLAGYYFTR